jgi:hypothetical protein
MKKIFFLMLALLIMSVASMNAQVRIGGTDNPNPSAVLDLNATDAANNGDLGLALPRVQLTSTGEPAPLDAFVKGMTVYNTASTVDVTEGTYYCDGVRWIKVRNSADMIGVADLSGDVMNLMVALAKEETVTNNCPASVNGSKGTYRVRDFGTAGCWMIDHSKEGTPSATHFNEGLEGEMAEGLRGYYYTWEQAQSACPTGFSLPTAARFFLLAYVLERDPALYALWVGDGYGGKYNPLQSVWEDWGLGNWWAADRSIVYWNYINTNTWRQSLAFHWFGVRCIKN